MPGWEVISWVLVIALPLSIPAAALTMPGHQPHFPEAVAGAALRRAVLAMDRLLRVERRHGDGRDRAGVGDQLLQPFVTFALAAFFNDETITLQILLFAAAVVVTVAMTRTRAKAAPAPPQQDREPPQLVAS